jgi:hypothetical protein
MQPFDIDIGKKFFLGGNIAIGDAAEYQAGLLPVLSVIIKNLYVLVGIILLIMIFVGGIGMILNAGNAEAAKKSNQTITSAVIGFAILIAAYWLVRIIETVFGLTILNPGPTL